MYYLILPLFVKKTFAFSNDFVLRKNAWASCPLLIDERTLAAVRSRLSTALSSTSCLRFVTTTTSSTSLVRVRACSLSNSLGREAPSLLLHHLKLFFCDLILVQDWDLNFTTFVITREQSALNLHSCLKIWHSEFYLGGTLALKSWSGSGGTSRSTTRVRTPSASQEQPTLGANATTNVIKEASCIAYF